MITGAIQKRIDSNLLRLSDGSAAAEYTGACRLFNGFTEGDKSLAIDLFGSTVVIHDYGTKLSVKSLTDMLRQELPFIRAVLWKKRNGSNKNGILLHGGQDDLCSQICEHGVNYAIDLTTSRYPASAALSAGKCCGQNCTQYLCLYRQSWRCGFCRIGRTCGSDGSF